jgi:UDP-2,3-diacylglucosamine pyrophosphatase LpxH
MDEPRPRSFRSIWISDLHLGAPECQVACVLDFIRNHESEYLYLVGDIFDGWRLRRKWRWNPLYNDFVQKVLRRARKGCRVTYIPGNHDSFARAYAGVDLGGIALCRQALHTTVDGRRLLVLHGDEFDSVVAASRWLSEMGGRLYSGAILLNRGFNAVRRCLGLPYWSLSAWLKHKVKTAVTHIDRFETAVAAMARQHGADGIVCGHIHRAAIRRVEDVMYYNSGDWVESCTALVEHFDGSMELLAWPHARESDLARARGVLSGKAVPARAEFVPVA